MIALILGTAVIVFALLLIAASLKRHHYNPAQSVANMQGKTVIITGGNAGIGKETARAIARKGARVILACRNLETAHQARDEICRETRNDNVLVKKLDLSSQKSIRVFADEIVKTETRLDVLIHNAGIAVQKIQMTEDNLETTMATNQFGPFLLTHLLFDLLKKSAPSRIVVVASEWYRLVTFNINHINPPQTLSPILIYYHSKYANILFTRELSRRLEGTGVTANCLHPGIVQTDIWQSGPAIFRPFMRFISRAFFKTPVEGCQTSVFLACTPELAGVSGRYFSECREKRLSSKASDMETAKKLWDLSENLVNLKPSDPKI